MGWPLLLRVVNVLPHEHFTLTSLYSGWVSIFMSLASPRNGLLSVSGLRAGRLGDLSQEFVVGTKGL